MSTGPDDSRTLTTDGASDLPGLLLAGRQDATSVAEASGDDAGNRPLALGAPDEVDPDDELVQAPLLPLSDEFVCPSCHLVQHGTRRSTSKPELCLECTG